MMGVATSIDAARDTGNASSWGLYIAGFLRRIVSGLVLTDPVEAALPLLNASFPPPPPVSEDVDFANPADGL